MSLYDHIPPSERAAELALIVKRIRKHTGLAVVPMLVVEGPSDEALLAKHCGQGPKQVFAAGTRGLVEQMLVFLRQNPVDGCECVFLTDCDGIGKAVHLKHEPGLIVTTGRDAEADLVSLGVAERVAAELAGRPATDTVQRAIEMSLPLSLLRRRAELAAVSMKWKKRRLRLVDLPPQDLERWADDPPTEEEMRTAVGTTLQWSSAQSALVSCQQIALQPVFARYGSGKDALDALWFLLSHRELHRGTTVDAFHALVRRGLTLSDLATWEVGRRLKTWQETSGLVLVPELDRADGVPDTLQCRS